MNGSYTRAQGHQEEEYVSYSRYSRSALDIWVTKFERRALDA
jgi:hypothetical protein